MPRTWLRSLVLLGSAIVPAAASATVPLHRCDDVGGAFCATVVVPLDRTRPEGPTIALHVEVHPRQAAGKSALEPIVAVQGGPGGSSTADRDSYVDLVGPLIGRHELILLDLPGTGLSDAIQCHRAQDSGTVSAYLAGAAACARQLGPTANDYGTGSAADDLATVLDALGIPTVDLYGDSYGTYFAQAFALRHPDRLRALILDGAYPVGGFDPWGRDSATALRSALRLVCLRAVGCHGDPVARLGALALRLTRHPLVGSEDDADGYLEKVHLDGRALVDLLAAADLNSTIYRDIDAAGRSLASGDAVPLLRLGAEDLSSGGDLRGPRTNSTGLYLATTCHDYPQLWNVGDPPAQRLAEERAGKAGLAPASFAPFSLATWADSHLWTEVYLACLHWPAATADDPAAPAGAAYPYLPTLVLNGDLDQRTPASGGFRAASAFPDSHFVQVANTGHVTALGDRDSCASAIVRHFIRTLDPGDVSCVGRIEQIRAVQRFAVLTGQASAATRAGADDRSTDHLRRQATVIAETLADAMSRYEVMYTAHGVGLRGGTFTDSGPYYGPAPVDFTLTRCRFTRDLAVSGHAVWNKGSGAVRARLAAAGGRVRVTWNAHGRPGVARVRGILGGRRVDLMLSAP